MKQGDLVKFNWGYKDCVGIVLQIERHDQSKDKSRGPKVICSFEILEFNGRKNWYDVWSNENEPIVLSIMKS